MERRTWCLNSSDLRDLPHLVDIKQCQKGGGIGKWKKRLETWKNVVQKVSNYTKMKENDKQLKIIGSDI